MISAIIAVCKHRYCHRCLLKWIIHLYDEEKRPICPLCRRIIDVIILWKMEISGEKVIKVFQVSILNSQTAKEKVYDALGENIDYSEDSEE